MISTLAFSGPPGSSPMQKTDIWPFCLSDLTSDPGVFGDEVKMSVIEGDPVTLHTDLTDMRGVTRIIWRVGAEVPNCFLLRIDENKTIDVHDSDVRFKDRLQVNNQTGDLTIKNMRVKHSGLYEAEIITSSGKTNKSFIVTVNAAVACPAGCWCCWLLLCILVVTTSLV